MPTLSFGLLLPLMLVPAALGAIEWREVTLGDTVLTYALVRPDAPAVTPPPALLALPPGNQSRAMVEAGLNRYWGERAAERGWIVVSPVAPEGTSFWKGAESLVPGLLDHVAREHTVEGDRFHLAGASNGGRSAFRVATLFPERFHSVTVLPGFPATDADVERLGTLRRLPVAMFVGEADQGWKERTMTTAGQLGLLGADVTVRVLPGEGHVPPSLDGPVMLDHLERVRARIAAARVLDDFHDAAAQADGPRYFGHFTDDALFIGTDPGERWTLASFRTYAEPHFSRGQGWTYVATSRRVRLDDSATVAWFDEDLDNAKYGRCRGTGVLVLRDGAWRIAQYALTIPIPNALAAEVVERIRDAASPDP